MSTNAHGILVMGGYQLNEMKGRVAYLTHILHHCRYTSSPCFSRQNHERTSFISIQGNHECLEIVILPRWPSRVLPVRRGAIRLESRGNRLKKFLQTRGMKSISASSPFISETRFMYQKVFRHMYVGVKMTSRRHSLTCNSPCRFVLHRLAKSSEDFPAHQETCITSACGQS
jgi:hypothetical protein